MGFSSQQTFDVTHKRTIHVHEIGAELQGYRKSDDVHWGRGRDSSAGWNRRIGGVRVRNREAERLSAIIQALMTERRERETQMAEERELREREFERQRLQRENEMQEKFDMVMRMV